MQPWHTFPIQKPAAVKVNGGSFTVEGRYNLDTFNGDQVLMKDDFWGVKIISYDGRKWSLCETSGHGSCYRSHPTNASCIEEAGGLFTQRETLEVSCTLALAWYYILLLCLIGAGASLLLLLLPVQPLWEVSAEALRSLHTAPDRTCCWLLCSC